MAQVIERVLLNEADLPDRQLTDLITDPNTNAELKIGVSAGSFLCELASFYSEKLFVGIELKPHSCRIAARRILAKELTNALVINIEAHQYIRTWVNDHAFDAVHIYFPTPFPYSIGLPHRLINSPFIADVHRILKPFGILRIVTDDKEYYEQICCCLKAQHWWALDWRPLEVTANNYFVGTLQEVRYCEERHPQVFAVRLVRIMRSKAGSSAQSNSVLRQTARHEADKSSGKLLKS